MCMTASPVASPSKWNWGGDRILHDCVVPSFRPVVGKSGPRNGYPIDVREFLATDRNEIVRRALRHELPRFYERQGVDLRRVESRDPGTFDLRAALVRSWVSETVSYSRVTGLDAWQFPDETLSLRRGDCEDRALLLASLLVGSGISPYNVRVALGQVRSTGPGGSEAHDHAWVMYRNEGGHWMPLELVEGRRSRRRAARPRRVEYVPYYVFNRDHLWEVARSGEKPSLGEVALRRRWARIHPRFAGDVHFGIVTDALSIPQCPAWVRDHVTSQFHAIGKDVIDDQDDFLSHGYDPFDHFDNGFIAEGWQRVHRRTRAFAADPEGSLGEFASAAHGIADFYAHSSFAHFAPVEEGALRLFDPGQRFSGLDRPARYGPETGFDLVNGGFTTNPSWAGGPAAAADAWNGYLISGRYAQPGDRHDPLESLVPSPACLREPRKRAALPHHDEIAVDQEALPDGHVLYRGDPGRYAEQFRLRRDAAVRHIRQAFVAAWGTRT